CGSLMEAQNRLRPRCINTKSHNKVLTAILDAIDHQDAQIQLREVALQQRVDLLGAGQYKSITDRRLAQAESPFPFSDGRIVSVSWITRAIGRGDLAPDPFSTTNNEENKSE